MKAVILAGGGGTRLWPLSTPEKPKQFQKIVSEKSMLEETLHRLDFLQPEDIYLAINQEHLAIVKEIAASIPQENIIIEPALRDTASCIGLAAALIEKQHPGEVMAVIYADHLIKDKVEFQKKLQLAAEIAAQEKTLNIIEVTATEPNTNYGYVKLGKIVEEKSGQPVYQLDRFIEKPDFETACDLIKDGNYLWNTGIYVWKTDVLLNYYQKLIPDTFNKLNEIQAAFGTPDFPSKLSSIYPTLEKISIDYAIMEKVEPAQVRIIPAQLGWSDIGNWEAIWQELSNEPSNNIVRGNVQTLDCESSLIYSETGKKVAVIGVKDLVVVDTEDGLLISDKKQSKRIKELNF